MDRSSAAQTTHRPGLAGRLLRQAGIAAVVYPTLFVVVMLLAMGACYVWPWLLDPVGP